MLSLFWHNERWMITTLELRLTFSSLVTWLPLNAASFLLTSYHVLSTVSWEIIKVTVLRWYSYVKQTGHFQTLKKVLLAFVGVRVKGMLMWVLGVPPLAGDAWCGLVDFPTVILPPATETVGREAGPLAFLNLHLSWGGRSWTRIKLAGHLWRTEWI